MTDQPETYDVWAISDPQGPVVYVAVATDAPVSAGDLVAQHRREAASPRMPGGVIEGVWNRTRQRLVAGPGPFTAEIVDPEVPVGRAATRTATMARGEEAVAWVPEALLAPPEPPKPAPRRANTTSRTPPPRTATPRVTTPRAATPARPAAPKAPPPPPPEPTKQLCPSCFMLRWPEQLDDDGTCLDGCL
jgi:hypothetical protein